MSHEVSAVMWVIKGRSVSLLVLRSDVTSVLPFAIVLDTFDANAINGIAYAGDTHVLISCSPRGGRSAAELS